MGDILAKDGIHYAEVNPHFCNYTSCKDQLFLDRTDLDVISQHKAVPKNCFDRFLHFV